MIEFESLDRCAAYVAARAAVEAIDTAAPAWSEDVATHARQRAVDVVMTIADAVANQVGSAGRRRCLRTALATAIELAATLDVARALGARDEPTVDAQRSAGRTVAMLRLFFLATTHPIEEVRIM